MLKSKIQARSQEELKSYFNNYQKEIEKQGFFNPDYYSKKRIMIQV